MSMMSTVADIMNPKLLYISEGDRLSLARAQILKFGITAVPVLDVCHRPVGMVSLRDLDGREELASAGTPVHTVQSVASLQEGARALATSGAHDLVVVDESGVAVGIVSALDFVRALVGAPVPHPPAFDRYKP